MKFYIFFAFLIPAAINAQSLDNWVISSGGESKLNSGIQLSWTLGEPNTATINKNQYMITEGFHQSYLALSALPLPLQFVHRTAVQVFPNPTADMVQIYLTDNTARDFEVRLLDANGKLLQYHQYQSAANAQLNLQNLPAATYLISIQWNELQPSLPQTFQIIKH